MTGAQAAQRIGVRPETLYPWLHGKSRPRSTELIFAFLDSVPADRPGIKPTGYQYREYKNWRGIPKPRPGLGLPMVDQLAAAGWKVNRFYGGSASPHSRYRN
jgi:hypothetical protein